MLWSDEAKIKEAWCILGGHALVRWDQDKWVWLRGAPWCLAWSGPGLPQWMHSPNSEEQRWECDDIWGCMSAKSAIYRWHHECLWVYQTTSWQSWKLGRRGILQQNDQNEKFENYDMAKYAAWFEHYRTPLGRLKETCRATRPLQQRAAGGKKVSEEWQNISSRICASLLFTLYK